MQTTVTFFLLPYLVFKTIILIIEGSQAKKHVVTISNKMAASDDVQYSMNIYTFKNTNMEYSMNMSITCIQEEKKLFYKP